MAEIAGVVLAGGRSSRMGAPKAALEWHGSTLLRRTTAMLARVLDGPVLVVRAPSQALPALPADVVIVDDPAESRGPLQGIAAGLAAAAAVGAHTAFVCATDLPFLHPAFVGHVLQALEDGDDVAVPHINGHHQPLAAAYRTAVAPVAAELLASGERRLATLFERLRVRRIDEAALLADRIAVMCEGKVVQYDTPTNVIMRPANRFVAELVGADDLLRRLSLVSVAAAMISLAPGDPIGPDEPAIDLPMRVRPVLSMLLESGVPRVIVRDEGAPAGYLDLAAIQAVSHPDFGDGDEP